MFTSRIGENNGVYTVIASERSSGTKMRVTMRCTVCGGTVTRSSTTFGSHDLTHCMCDFFRTTEQNQKNSAARGCVHSVRYSRCKAQFHSMLKDILTKYPDVKHDDFDTIWAALGEPPEDTEVCEWHLSRKYRARRCRDFTVENMEWERVVKTSAVNAARALTTCRTDYACKHAAKMNVDAKSMDDFALGITKMWLEKKRCLREEYALFIGRRFKSWRVVYVEKTIIGRGRTVYNFGVRCERCGKRRVIPAAKVLGKCESCHCMAHAGAMAKNSSTTSGSRLLIRRMMDSRKRIRMAHDGYDPDSLLLLQGHISEYTLYAGMEQTIYALIDNELMKSEARQHREEYLEWLGG